MAPRAKVATSRITAATAAACSSNRFVRRRSRSDRTSNSASRVVVRSSKISTNSGEWGSGRPPDVASSSPSCREPMSWLSSAPCSDSMTTASRSARTQWSSGRTIQMTAATSPATDVARNEIRSGHAGSRNAQSSRNHASSPPGSASTASASPWSVDQRLRNRPKRTTARRSESSCGERLLIRPCPSVFAASNRDRSARSEPPS